MEEHLWSQKSFVTNIDFYWFSSAWWLMNILFKLVRKIPFSIVTLFLLIKLLKFLYDILAYISILFFNGHCDGLCIFTRKIFFPFTKLHHSKLGDISSSKRNMLNTWWNDLTVSNRQNMCHTISGINNDTCHVWLLKILASDATICTSNLTVQCQSSLFSNEKTFHAKCLKHDFSHLFSVFRRVHWWLRQDKPMFFRLASEVWIYRFVPELFNTFPIFNHTSFEQITNLMCLLMSHGFLSNIVVHFKWLEFWVFL